MLTKTARATLDKFRGIRGILIFDEIPSIGTTHWKGFNTPSVVEVIFINIFSRTTPSVSIIHYIHFIDYFPGYGARTKKSIPASVTARERNHRYWTLFSIQIPLRERAFSRNQNLNAIPAWIAQILCVIFSLIRIWISDAVFARASLIEHLWLTQFRANC